MSHRTLDHALLAGLVLFVGAVAIAPLGRLLAESVAPGGELDLTVAREVLSARSTWRATWNSLVTATWGTVISLVLGAAFALLVALSDIRPV